MLSLAVRPYALLYIISHFQKEAQLFHKGIKTLSLFFIDEVAHYRQYDADGNEALGEFGRIFEEEYVSVMNGYRILLAVISVIRPSECSS